MATMSDAERKAVWETYNSTFSREARPIPIKKQALRTAIDETDQWISDNEASFNAALSEPAKSALSKRGKAALLLFVIERRYRLEV